MDKPSAAKYWCETCEGLGTVDETLGGEPFSNPKAPCPDCGGQGWHSSPALGMRYRIEFDGFVGTVIGSYRRLDGEEGVVMQQDGSKIVHVYRRKWLIAAPTVCTPTLHPPKGTQP